MRKWEKADLVHIQNLQKTLSKLKYDVSAKELVETYHCFNWVDKISNEIEAFLSSEKLNEDFQEAIKTAELKPNKGSKGPVKKTRK